MNDLTVINQNGQLLVDSREVAEMTGKRHADLLESIGGYIKYLTNGNFRSLDFFIEGTYQDIKGETRPCYLITRKGCDMVANKMTGEKGVLFTAAYVTKFEEMEQQVKFPELKLSKELQAIFMLDEKQQIIETKIKEVENKVGDLEDNMPLFNIECKELQSLVRRIAIKTLGGYKSPAYNSNSLRGKVFADIQYQLKREFGIHRYEAIKRSQLSKAINIVEAYNVPTVLSDEIQLANNQTLINV